ncbi:MAG TPA: hypothetical protein VEL76_01080 [Gemmataceae bacterium]|nr:hypothetical protein [Gemmataceae bacterium]
MISVLAGTLLVAAYLTLRGFDLLGSPGAAQVRDVPAGHQEIAFLVPATSGDAWERLVAALDALHRNWPRDYPEAPRLHVRKDKAFVELTADIAELALWLEGADGARLWVRWYKLSSENSAEKWIEKLTQRDPPPLAVIGGDISDRALALAQALQAARGKWRGPDPLLLLTTATADRYKLAASPGLDPAEDSSPRLIHIYNGRSFRFSFTNKQMARVVLDFVRSHPELWPEKGRDFPGAAGIAAVGDPWAALGLLANAEQFRLQTLEWADDSYSVDLARRFSRVFQRLFPFGRAVEDLINYSAGDYFQPNPREAFAIGQLVVGSAPDERRLLALPTAAQRAQRLLRTFVRRDPLQGRNLVVITGDSISFNSIYRDRNVAWNILDVPVPLVLFAHRNPVSTTAGFKPMADGNVEASCSSTEEILLNRDILEALVQGAYRERRVLTDADGLRDRLRQALWHKGHVRIPGFGGSPAAGQPNGPNGHLFDADGDRSARTGEHIVWLNPSAGGAPLVEPTITVWRMQPEGTGYTWIEARKPLEVRYNWTGEQP